MRIDQPEAWRFKHPCTKCKTGYGFCVQGLKANMMCCIDCDHPTRWRLNAYTNEELESMKNDS